MTDEQYREVTENVDLVINVAATVDFNEPLKDAISINVIGGMNNL